MSPVVSYPFDGQSVAEGEYGALASFWLGSGVVRHELGELAVYADSSGMQVKVPSGRAVLRGVFVENPTEATLAISGAHATLGRIDLVILRVDYVGNEVELDVLAGTPAASPTVPTLTQTGTVWEVGLAEVTVDAAAVTIAAGKITDRRASQAFCGFASNHYPTTNVLSTARPATWPEGGLIYETDTDTLHVNAGTYAAPSWGQIYPAAAAFDSVAPTMITPDTAAASGALAISARRDHTHGIVTDVPVTQGYADAPAEGSSAFFSRSDHRHGMPASGAISYAAPGSSAMGDAVAEGVAATASRSDHKHGRESFAAPSVAFSTAAAAGASAQPLRSDATLLLYDATSPVNQAFGDVAAPGAAGTAARRDHKHGMPAAGTNTLTKNTAGASITAGAEADWWTYSVVGGTLGTGVILRLTLEGEIQNFTGGTQTIDVRVYYGATLIAWGHVTGVPSSATGNDGYAFKLLGTLAAHGATNAQRSNFLLSLGGTDSGNNPPNTGITNQAQATSSHRAIAEDSTAAKTLKVTGQGSGTLNFTMFHVLLEQF